MASGESKRPGAENECPPELQCLVGEVGPYFKQDKAEFYHINREVQEWLIRIDRKELSLLLAALNLTSWVLSAAKWAKRIFWAFTGGLSAVLLAGEKLAKLPETISGAISGVSAAFKLARAWWGI